MQEAIDFLWNNGAAILAVLLAVSEILAGIPSVKSNSIFQLMTGLFKKLAGKE